MQLYVGRILVQSTCLLIELVSTNVPCVKLILMGYSVLEYSNEGSDHFVK